MRSNRHAGLIGAVAAAAAMTMNAAAAAAAKVAPPMPREPRLSFRERKRKGRREVHAGNVRERKHTNRAYVSHAPGVRPGVALCTPAGYPLPDEPYPGFPHVIAHAGESVMCNRCQVEQARLERGGRRSTGR